MDTVPMRQRSRTRIRGRQCRLWAAGGFQEQFVRKSFSIAMSLDMIYTSLRADTLNRDVRDL